MDILEQTNNNIYPRRVAAGFFDIGGSNMTTLFAQHEHTIAISQLPYYQTALPVFYMYLRVCIMFSSLVSIYYIPLYNMYTLLIHVVMFYRY